MHIRIPAGLDITFVAIILVFEVGLIFVCVSVGRDAVVGVVLLLFFPQRHDVAVRRRMADFEVLLLARCGRGESQSFPLLLFFFLAISFSFIFV